MYLVVGDSRRKWQAATLLYPPVVTLRHPRPALEPAVGSRASLYVRDLDEGVMKWKLYALFCEVAPVADLHVCRDVAGRSLGYAYINIHSRENGGYFLRLDHRHLLCQRPL